MTSTTTSTLIRALKEYVLEIKNDVDAENPFYLEVVAHVEAYSNSTSIAKDEHFVDFIKELEMKQSTTSTTRKIFRKLQPLVSGLNQYATAGDVLIQAADGASVLLYGGVRLVLLAAERIQGCFDTVLDIMEEVGDLLVCYHHFSEAFDEFSEMQHLLVRTYKNIVNFWRKAYELFTQKAYKTAFKNLIKPLNAEWSKCRENLSNDSNRVQRRAQAVEASIRRRKEKEEKRKDIIEWIKGDEDEGRLDVRHDMENLGEKRYRNTCDWLFQNKIVSDWITSNASMSICYSADPGAGKTVMAAAVAEKLRAQKGKTATFFCSFNDTARKKPITLLRSLALQLLSHFQSVPEGVEDLYYQDIAQNCRKLSNPRVARKVLMIILKELERVHCIVDGLDECDDRSALLAHISELIQTKHYGIVKWFFTTRRESDICSFMKKIGVTELEAPRDRIAADIKSWLSSWMECDHCIDRYTVMSECNFMWISHMMPVLQGETSTCREEFLEELEKFPRGLTGCYARTVAQIHKRYELSERHRQRVRLLFAIVVGASQPLRMSELTHALAASQGMRDYDVQKVPEKELITELGTNLIILDGTSQGCTEDPLVKVVHKSVQDFLLEDPTKLDLPDDALRQYFVTVPQASLELGRASLNYLRALRYNQPTDISTLFSSKENAFLRHAATFWHLYLTRAKHERSLANEVIEFLRSEAFWTCVAVQTRIAPYLFGRYTETKTGGFRLDAMGPKEDSDPDSIHYGVPLPKWLDHEDYAPEGHQACEAFYRFVLEWYTVLNSHPEVVGQCVMDFEWQMQMPGKIPRQSKRTNLFSIRHLASGHAFVSISNVQLQSKNIQVLGIRYNSSTQEFQSIETAVGAVEDELVEGAQSDTAMAITSSISPHARIVLTSLASAQSYWVVNSEDLSTYKFTASSNQLLEECRANNSEFCSATKRMKSWTILHNATAKPAKHDGAAGLPVAAFHCVREALTGLDNADTASAKESGYASMSDASSNTSSDSETDSGSESHSDSGISAISSISSNRDELSSKNTTTPTQHCMLLLRPAGRPTWHFWRSPTSLSEVKFEAPCTFHPTRSLALWSPKPGSLWIMDLVTGDLHSIFLPEPEGVSFEELCGVRKEFYVPSTATENDSVLYYLLYTAKRTDAGTKHTIYLSVLSFKTQTGGQYILETMQAVRTISFYCIQPIQSPLLLTDWMDDVVYVAMPFLSCNPKLVRLQLGTTLEEGKGNKNGQKPGDGDDAGEEHQFETLKEPMYLPYSTPYRHPRLRILRRKATSRHVTLTVILDPEYKPPRAPLLSLRSKKPHSDIPAKNVPNLDHDKPPAVFICELHAKKDWRAWDDEKDGRDSEVMDEERKYAMLRGKFVDKDKRFEVPVRSGLDVTRQAFLSCS